MTKQERQKRVIARGEHSNHSHVVVGDCEITRNAKDEIIINVGDEGAVLKHILELEYIEMGKEIWTEEHLDIPLTKGTYKYEPQLVYDPLLKRIESARD